MHLPLFRLQPAAVLLAGRKRDQDLVMFITAGPGDLSIDGQRLIADVLNTDTVQSGVTDRPCGGLCRASCPASKPTRVWYL